MVHTTHWDEETERSLKMGAQIMNVVSINRGPSFGANQNRETQQKDSRFFIGVALTVGIAESVWAFYWGPLAAVALGANLAAGIVLGLVLYYCYPFEVISCLHRGTQPEAPPAAAPNVKKAA
jgi:hypothetical protein